MGASHATQNAALRFASSWDAHWEFDQAQEQDQCQLSQVVANYGVARFVASPAYGVGFELQAQRDWFAQKPVHILRTPPVWERNTQVPNQTLGDVVHIPGGGAIVGGDTARAMFWAIRSGDRILLRGDSRFDAYDGIEVVLASLGFGEALDDFLDCAGTMIEVSWAQLSRTRIGFDSNMDQLSMTDRLKLDAIATYVKHDTSITRLYVDGHADSSGDRRKNQKLSQRRAKVVRDYLIARGVDKDKVVMRYHGARYPVADNKNSQGRTQNRRTTVRLEKQPHV